MAAKTTAEKRSDAEETPEARMAEKTQPQTGKAAKKKSVDKKLWPFFILKVLKRHAADGAECDDGGNRYLTRQQIVGFLSDDYGIDTQMRAVGDNLTRLYDASLEDASLGFRLEYLEGERNAPGTPAKGAKQLLRRGWRYVEARASDEDGFEPSEVRMLIDTVVASSVIPPRQVNDLVRKLNALVGNEIVVPNIGREGHLPASNPQFFYNVETLHDAIRDKKRVRFALGVFGKDGKLGMDGRGERDKRHDMVPMQLLVSKGHYYLLAHYPDGSEVYKYRVDLMRDVEIVEDSHVDADESKVNVVRFREQHAYMMSGKPVNVVLRINKESLHTFYDQFGPKAYFKNEREDTIDVEFRSALYSVLFWALQYYRTVEVLSPPELREVLAGAGAMVHDMYAGKPGAIGLADRQSSDELVNGK